MTPHDHAPPVSPLRAEPASPSPPPQTKASGSNKRQRNHKTGTRWDDAEYAALNEKAQETGLSRDSYIRACALGTPGPRARRAPHVNAVVMGNATAALNKAGNVLNQYLPHLHAGKSITLGRECAEALAEVRAAAAAIRESTGRKDPE